MLWLGGGHAAGADMSAGLLAGSALVVAATFIGRERRETARMRGRQRLD